MATPILSQEPLNAPRPRPSRRPSRRRLVWLLGLALCGVLVTLVARSLLIRQMRLPRLTLDQGGNVTSVAITPDSKTTFSGNDPTRDALRFHGNKPADVFVWDTATGRLVRRLHGFYWRSEGVTASPDGATVVASGTVRRGSLGLAPSNAIVYDWRTGRRLWQIEGGMPFSYSPDGRLVGIGNGLYQAMTGARVRETFKTYSEDRPNGFSPDGKFFGLVEAPTLSKNGSSDSDNGDKLYYSTIRLHLWELDKGKEVRDYPFIRVRAFDFSHDGQWLVMTSDTGIMAGGMDGSAVRRVDVRTGSVLWTRERSLNAPDNDADAVLNSVAISPNGKYVVLQSIYDRLVVLDAATGHELFRPFASPDQHGSFWAIPGGLAFSADGKTLISRCGSKVLVWDASSLQ